jgi:hypothetical protein
MKIQKTVALLACLMLCLFRSFAQSSPVPPNEPNYSRPKIFTDLPEKQSLHVKEAESLLDMSVGTKVNVHIAKNLQLTGVIVSKSDPASSSVKSVVVKSNLRQGTTFTFTRISEANGKVTYIGRMINRGAGDALEITREGDNYILRKKGIYEVINE